MTSLAEVVMRFYESILILPQSTFRTVDVEQNLLSTEVYNK